MPTNTPIDEGAVNSEQWNYYNKDHLSTGQCPLFYLYCTSQEVVDVTIRSILELQNDSLSNTVPTEFSAPYTVNDTLTLTLLEEYGEATVSHNSFIYSYEAGTTGDDFLLNLYFVESFDP